MSPSLMERPVLQAAPEICIPDEHCHEKCERTEATEEARHWLSQKIIKSYVSSLNFCLGELGWVPMSILEIGSGNGDLLSYLAQTFMSAHVVGVEFEAKKIEAAKANNCCRIQFVELEPSETLPFESNSFDLVISHGALSTSPLPRHLISEMSRVSAEGMILSAQGALPYKWFKHLPGAKEVTLSGNPIVDQDVRPISLSQLRNWVTRSGMKIESYTAPFPYHMLMCRKPKQA